MISNKTLKCLEFDKILAIINKFAVLNSTKKEISDLKPFLNYNDVLNSLNETMEGYNLLYVQGVSGVEYFSDLTDELERSKKGAILSLKELLNIASLLRSSRITSSAIIKAYENENSLLKDIALKIYIDTYLENEINSKIINENTISDNASTKLYQIRQNIKNINEKIREKLNNYIKSSSKYLQDNLVSIRNGRYVIPVKSEHLQNVKGFVHDRSASGSTFFIEPQEVLELNNELRSEILNEQAEIEKILLELSNMVGLISNYLDNNVKLLTKIDLIYAKSQYAFSIKGVYPKINVSKNFNIIKGRHPLIDKNKVIPIDISIPDNYNFLLITGPNTGGKTVSLKLVGLFTLMAMSGIFLPCSEDSLISIFENIEVDIGDEQSIEQNLSTFSSHLKNIINILENSNDKTLVLIDEIGAGTDPDEGSSLSKAILEDLISKGCYGIITTHYSMLKEYAMNNSHVKNASMLFDLETFEPKYKLNIGMPGSSNAIEIALRLGLDKNVANNAKKYLSPQKIEFDNVLKEAEKVRITAENTLADIEKLKQEQLTLYNNLVKDKEAFDNEKQKFLLNSKLQARKIVNEKLEVAEELLSEMKEIFNKESYLQSDLVKMATLKNKIENERFTLNNEGEISNIYPNIDVNKAKVGDVVYVKSINSNGEILEINKNKKTAWVQIGSLRLNAKITDIFLISNKNSKIKNVVVNVKRESVFSATKTEINVIGKNTDEALIEVKNFLDSAIINNLEEVRIVHGKGLNILSKAIHNYLKTDKNVIEYRFGRYGEGEHGATIVKLK